MLKLNWVVNSCLVIFAHFLGSSFPAPLRIFAQKWVVAVSVQYTQTLKPDRITWQMCMMPVQNHSGMNKSRIKQSSKRLSLCCFDMENVQFTMLHDLLKKIFFFRVHMRCLLEIWMSPAPHLLVSSQASQPFARAWPVYSPWGETCWYALSVPGSWKMWTDSVYTWRSAVRRAWAPV